MFQQFYIHLIIDISKSHANSKSHTLCLCVQLGNFSLDFEVFVSTKRGNQSNLIRTNMMPNVLPYSIFSLFILLEILRRKKIIIMNLMQIWCVLIVEWRLQDKGREIDQEFIFVAACVFYSSIFALALKIARLFGLCSVEINESWNVTRFSHFFVAFAELTMKNYSLNMLIQEFPAALDSTVWNHNK